MPLPITAVAAAVATVFRQVGREAELEVPAEQSALDFVTGRDDETPPVRGRVYALVADQKLVDRAGVPVETATLSMPIAGATLAPRPGGIVTFRQEALGTLERWTLESVRVSATSFVCQAARAP